MKKRKQSITAAPTALVASATRRSPKKARSGVLPGLRSSHGSDLRDLVGSTVDAFGHLRPGHKKPSRRSGLAGGRRSRRRKGRAMRLARQAGTALSAVAFAADVVSELRRVGESYANNDSGTGEGGDRRPSGEEQGPEGGGRRRSGRTGQRARSPERDEQSRPTSGSRSEQRGPAKRAPAKRAPAKRAPAKRQSTPANREPTSAKQPSAPAKRQGAATRKQAAPAKQQAGKASGGTQQGAPARSSAARAPATPHANGSKKASAAKRASANGSQRPRSAQASPAKARS